jgi:hypothetical protein
MAKIDYNIYEDPTLKKMDECLEEKQKLELPRRYLGMSEIGKPCQRELFYSFRGVARRIISSQGIKAIEDGYDQEAKTIARLRAVPGIELYNDNGEGQQIGFEMLLSHFRGHCDGVVKGLLQSPATWHVFEHKSVNETKFNKLISLVQSKGEKQALIEWDEIYFSQAQIYMRCLDITRHYMVVSTPGGRAHTSCRTEYSAKKADLIIEKAQSIIFDNFLIPARISNKREAFSCKFCAFIGICHDGDIPDVNCRSCRYRECVKDGQNNCLASGEIIPDDVIDVGCSDHIFNPALMPEPAKLIEHEEDGCVYKIVKEGYLIIFSNTNAKGIPNFDKEVDEIYTSIELKEKIKNINNIKKEIKETKLDMKAWAGKNIDTRLKGI